MPDIKSLAQLSPDAEDCPKYDESPWCPCYQFEDGVFLECPTTGIKEIRITLSLIDVPIKSLGIYHLDKNITMLPAKVFVNASISHLLMSYTNLESLDEHALLGLEDSLDSLSIVNSKLKDVPQKALSTLKALTSVDFDSNEIQKVEGYAFYGVPLTTVNLQGNQIESLSEYAFGGLENTLQELLLINNRLSRFPLGALRRLRKLKTLKLVKNFIDDILDDGFTRFTDLQTLDMNSNRLKELHDRSFVTMPRLTVLSLQMNQLFSLDDRVFIHFARIRKPRFEP
ncbi:protein artichoke [Caerostris extrusa]|uniref:Protein artichoke n=1 Tax=Caerostris extrusa TaxID=172846 RepID=A0AAV4UG50_CAEEX|nr:protein artichoke [Caerostris extrusa]